MVEENTSSNPKENILKSPQGDNFAFPKKEKLKNKKVIEALFTEGKNIKQNPIKLIYLNTNFSDDSKIKVAVVAPKKKFKKAVDRNRVKRLLREAYRLNKPLIFNNIEGNFAFIFLYLGNTAPSFNEVDKAMKLLLEAFLKKEFHENKD
ncbi:ribonuclease P protein component [Allomuricauda sp. NBRC 101325]|uniref:ribonuclease P protein component n=1 Tax=Allomuricauda sp. NBRC 101325 TaxID=1113758 RepID=UPI0024A3B47C|nr:ribonuclease P protein component [Muricauda sp. NBRC 101325]GLU43255.1 ribonuclease P protein component [Muricauda sp. NBRC 101325]